MTRCSFKTSFESNSAFASLLHFSFVFAAPPLKSKQKTENATYRHLPTICKRVNPQFHET